MFLRSYELQATPARGKKLREFLSKEGRGTCSVSSSAGAPVRFKVEWSPAAWNGSNEPTEEIFALHPATTEIDPAIVRVSWPQKLDALPYEPRIVDRIVLGDDAITVIEAPSPPYSRVAPTIDGHLCGTPARQ